MRGSMRRLISVTALIAWAVLAASCARGGVPERGAELRVEWVLPQEFPARILMHRVAPERSVPVMQAFERGVEPALGAAIEDGVLRVELDRAETVLVVLQNPFDRPMRFWVAPHLPVPHSAESALMIRCLCTGETYEVPAGGTWVRAVQLGVRRREAVERMVVAHVITMGEAPSVEGAATH